MKQNIDFMNKQNPGIFTNLLTDVVPLSGAKQKGDSMQPGDGGGKKPASVDDYLKGHFHVWRVFPALKEVKKAHAQVAAWITGYQKEKH